jgi:Rab GDP dissociation inhibitor
MNEEYDVIVLGTGLKECVLSGLLAVQGKKVLHLDRNSYYGAETASLNLTNLWAMFRPNVKPPEQYGHNRDWNIDLIPKFIMAGGTLVKMLLHTKVTRYLEWKCCDASYVLQNKKGGMFSSAKTIISKVPSNDKEALKSDLMGLFEKKRCRNFVLYLDKVVVEDKATWGDLDLEKCAMSAVYKKFSLEENTIDFIGHALAMELDDAYLSKPALATIKNI